MAVWFRRVMTTFGLARPRRTDWSLRRARLVGERQAAKVDLLATQLRAEAKEAERRLIDPPGAC